MPRDSARGSALARRPTISSVAEYAGVSTQTVSNALNYPERLKPETRKRVLAAIKKTGYVPSAAAQQMRTARTGVLAYRLDPVRDGIAGFVLDDFLHALTSVAKEHNYRVMLYTAESDKAEREQFGELVQARAVDGFVLVGTHRGDRRYAWLIDHRIPFSVFGRPWPGRRTTTAEGTAPAHAWVDVDGAHGTRQATQHLHDRGYGRIAFIGSPRDGATGDDRRRGWEEALDHAGVPARQRLKSLQPDGVLQGAEAAARLLSAGADAFVCASDSLAIGAFSAVRLASEQAAVVGFDDTPAAAAMGLTSVRQPLREAARQAVESVLAQMRGLPASPAGPELLPPELIVRASSPPAEPAGFPRRQPREL